MKRSVYNRSPILALKDALLPLIFGLAIVAIVVYGVAQAQESSSDEGLRLLTEGLHRASVKCYAVEGAYPETLQYLEDNYGVFIDRNRYEVFYVIFAANYPPDITVIPRQR
ncbi:MAG: hypothetical protein FWE76_04785 [Symbiobacteriaceae bacterium]|nr:hypothetical protein [Symbiobacteriaceae bacterium]